MTEKEKDNLKTAILRKIARLKSDIKELKEETKPVKPDCAIGRVSRMDAINNNAVNLATLRKKEAQFRGLETAMENIDNPDFGYCVKCKNEIPPGRLLLVPESTKCVNCARL